MKMEFCMQIGRQVMLNAIKTGNNENVVVSPLSLHAMLNLVASGSTGRTQEQLLSFLDSGSISNLNTQSLKIMDIARMSQTHPETLGRYRTVDHQGPILGFVNGIWIDHQYPLKDSFKDIATSIYKADARSVDFLTQGEQVREEVNSWVENATKGLIKEILSPGWFNQETILVLANALYFNGTWLHTFDSSRTRHKSFHLLSGATKEVPFMIGDINMKQFYGSFEGFKLLKLPYQNGQDKKRFCMYVFLPDKRNGLQEIIEKVHTDSRFLNCEFELEKIELSKMWIPKLKFEYEFQASDVMQDLGLTLPFMRMGEFTEMVDCVDNKEVYVSRMIHKSCIEVNEKGTEATAATITCVPGFKCPLVPPPPPPSFVADHPFMFC